MVTDASRKRARTDWHSQLCRLSHIRRLVKAEVTPVTPALYIGWSFEDFIDSSTTQKCTSRNPTKSALRMHYGSCESFCCSVGTLFYLRAAACLIPLSDPLCGSGNPCRRLVLVSCRGWFFYLLFLRRFRRRLQGRREVLRSLQAGSLGDSLVACLEDAPSLAS
jgi:hypothetical protein